MHQWQRWRQHRGKAGQRPALRESYPPLAGHRFFCLRWDCVFGRLRVRRRNLLPCLAHGGEQRELLLQYLFRCFQVRLKQLGTNDRVKTIHVAR